MPSREKLLSSSRRL